MKLAGANPRAVIKGAEALPGTVNYFIGKDPNKWTTGATTYGKVNYRQIYHGIDLVYYGTQRQLEYDFVVAPGADPKRVIDGMSLTIRPGEKVGLVGPSGAGKSTLVNLLLRFFDLEEGRILIDGQDIATVTQESLRAQISVVTQDTSLLHRSIRDNIRYGRPEATDAEIVAAAKLAHAHEFIVGLPRSGTTLLSQLLAYSLDAGYTTNFAARFWLAPVHGLRLGRRGGVVAGEDPRPPVATTPLDVERPDPGRERLECRVAPHVDQFCRVDHADLQPVSTDYCLINAVEHFLSQIEIGTELVHKHDANVKELDNCYICHR
jgi:ABC-type oligopeptide transport system ATPase subunit